MKSKAMKPPKQRNLVHLALLQTKRNGVHGKSIKQQRANGRIALRRKIGDEGVFIQCTVSAY